MSDTKTIQTYRPIADLMAQDNQIKIERMANMIVKTAPGGQNLSKPEAVQLAIFSFMTDLNIYNRECYWLPGVGPTDGIRGNRRKAKDYIRQNERAGDYYLKFRQALDHEAVFDEDAGDLAWHCTLTDDYSMDNWRKNFNKFFSEFREAGMDAKEAYEKAMYVAGDKPEWTGVGVVDHREKFSAREVAVWEGKRPKEYKKDEEGNFIYQPEKWDPNERAQKRAEKNALGKRYPHSIIPSYQDMMFEHGDVIDVVIREVTDRLDTPKQVDEGKLLSELGYEVRVDDHVQPGDVVAVTETDQVVLRGGSELDFAIKETTNEGTPYGDLETEQLTYMFNTMQKLLKKNDLSEEEKENYERKCACIQIIIKHRED